MSYLKLAFLCLFSPILLAAVVPIVFISGADGLNLHEEYKKLIFNLFIKHGEKK